MTHPEFPHLSRDFLEVGAFERFYCARCDQWIMHKRAVFDPAEMDRMWNEFVAEHAVCEEWEEKRE